MITTNLTITAVAGTSASAPVFGAMISLVNANRRANGQGLLGWVNPAMYTSTNTSWIKDITSGNIKCTANPEVCCSQGFYASQGW
jgi:hypothetical protein